MTEPVYQITLRNFDRFFCCVGCHADIPVADLTAGMLVTPGTTVHGVCPACGPTTFTGPVDWEQDGDRTVVLPPGSVAPLCDLFTGGVTSYLFDPTVLDTFDLNTTPWPWVVASLKGQKLHLPANLITVVPHADDDCDLPFIVGL